MGTLTPTSVQISDLPMDTTYGTGTRLVLVHVVGPSASGGSTIDMSTYCPGAVDIVGIVCESDNGAAEAGSAATPSTWSTKTLTVSNQIAGAWEGTYLVRTTS